MGMARDLHIAVLGPVDLGHLRSLCGEMVESTDQATGHPGAVALATLTYALALRGSRLTVITTAADVRQPRHEILPNGVTVIAVPQRVGGYGRDFQRVERRELSQALASLDDVDLVHAHWTYEYALAALSARRTPLLVSVRDWAPAILRRNLHPYNVARLGSQLYVTRRAPFLTANSPYIVSRLRRLGRDPFLLPNPISDEAFDWTRDAGHTLQRVVAINNGFVRHKNVETLLRAFALIRLHMPAASLALVGPGHGEGGPAHRWAAAHRLDRGVEFLGSQPPSEVRRLLGSASVLAHPSLEESFGAVLIEAMAAGVPVVAGAKSGAVPWVIGGAGRLCDVSQPTELADTLMEVLESPSTRTSLGEAGRLQTWERFRASSVAEQAVGIYKSVLAECGVAW